MSLVYRSSFVFLLCFCFPLVVTAQSLIDEVVVHVKYPNNDPVDGLSLELIDNNGLLVQSAYTDSSGEAIFYYVSEGEYKIKQLVSQSPTIENNALYRDREIPFTADFAQTVLGSLSQTQQIVVMALLPYSRVLRIVPKKVTLANRKPTPTSPPIVNAYVSGWSYDDPNRYIYGQVNSEGVFTIGLEETDTGRWGFYVSADGYGEKYIEKDLNFTGSLETFLIGLLATDATITVSFQTSNGQSFAIPTGQYGDVWCFNNEVEPPIQFQESFNPGDTSVSVPVVGGLGSYQCNVWLPEYAFNDAEVSVAPQATAQAVLTAYTFDGTAKLTFRDRQTGAIITGVPFDVSLYTIPNSNGGVTVDHYPYAYTDNGVVEFDLLSGQEYGVSVYVPQDPNSGNFNMTSTESYFAPKNIDPIIVSSGQTFETDISLTKSDAAIQVTLLNAEGVPVDGWATAYDPGSFASSVVPGTGTALDGEPEEEFFSDITLVNGVGTIPVVSGRKYIVTAGPFFENFGSAHPIPPKAQETQPASGETVTMTLQMRKPNYTLNLLLQAVDDNGGSIDTSGADFAGCFGYSGRDGEHTFSEDFIDGQVSLPLLVDTSGRSDLWRGGCHIALPATGEELYGKQYFGEWELKTKKGETSKALTVQLVDFGTFYEKETEDFSTTADTDLTFADGKSLLEIPGGAFGSGNRGSVEISSATGWRTADDSQVIKGKVFDITPYLDGSAITNPEKPVRFCTQIADGDLEKYNASIQSVKIARYDPNSQKWYPTTTTVVTENGIQKVCAWLDHFSIWGTIIDALKEARSQKPSDLKVRRKNGGKVVYRWTAPQSATSTTVYKLKYATKAKSKKKCENLDKGFTEVEVVGVRTTVKVRGRKKSKKTCAEVEVKDGLPSDRAFRKFR